MELKLKIWRQKNNTTKGEMVDYKLSGVEADMSFLEMLDLLNNQLIESGKEPVAFDHDCREVYVVLAHFTLMVLLMGQKNLQQLASYT